MRRKRLIVAIHIDTRISQKCCKPPLSRQTGFSFGMQTRSPCSLMVMCRDFIMSQYMATTLELVFAFSHDCKPSDTTFCNRAKASVVDFFFQNRSETRKPRGRPNLRGKKRSTLTSTSWVSARKKSYCQTSQLGSSGYEARRHSNGTVCMRQKA